MTVRLVSRSASLAVLILGLVGVGHAMGQADTLDTDGDGLVSYTELLMAMPEMTEEEFQALDADADGLLSPEELSAAEEAGLITLG
jgi:hypothetical protein